MKSRAKNSNAWVTKEIKREKAKKTISLSTKLPLNAKIYFHQRQRNKIKSKLRVSLSKNYETNRNKKNFDSVNCVKPIANKDRNE